MLIEQSSLCQGMRFLQEIAEAVVKASRVRPGESVAGYEPNATGATLIRPGGRECYPAFWIRDFAMSLESGLVSETELEHALLLTAHCQATDDLEVPSGSYVPRGAIADHITFDGKPIFFPGTVDDYESQGGIWGKWPSLDDHFYFVEMAWHLAMVHGRKDALGHDVDRMPLIERLEMAFGVPPARDDTQLVWCDDGNRGVSFGFVDSVFHTGELLFCSLLRNQAARHLADLFGLLGRLDKAARYRRVAEAISEQIPRVFSHESGLLRASTGKSAQPDVWGSAFAVYSGAIKEPEANKVARALLRALSAGTISWKGNIRHVPTDADFSGDSAWELVIGRYPKNKYQNGAYWNTPTGWVCFAVAQVSESAAMESALDYVNELQAGDFRQGDDCGSPYECIHPDGDYRQNPVYMTSVTCPLAAFRRLGWVPT